MVNSETFSYMQYQYPLDICRHEINLPWPKNAFECNLKGNKQSRRRKVTTKLHPLIVDIVLFFLQTTPKINLE